MAYSSSPISCQYCKDTTLCPFENIPELKEKELNYNVPDPKYPWKWLSEYCNQNHVGEIMQYYSLIVLLSPVFIIMIRSVIIGKVPKSIENMIYFAKDKTHLSKR